MRVLCMVAFLICHAFADVEPVEPVMKVLGKSWFVGETVETSFQLPGKEEPEVEWPDEGGDFQLVDVVVDSPGDDSGAYRVNMLWVPRRVGLLTIPSIPFLMGEEVVQSPQKQIAISEPVETDEMSLSLNPECREIYVGQPLRVDIEWRSDLRLGALRGLRLHPSFFNDPRIEVVVPRPTYPDDEQIGLPVGGRRVIARKAPVGDESGGSERSVGVIRFSLYLRFSESGTLSLEPAKLECARVLEKWSDFTNYASYFNNSLFELPGDDVRYERIYCRSEAHEIKVLPLPEEGRLESFSGLFEPVRIETEVQPTAAEVGQVMSLRVRVFSDVDGALLEIPSFGSQRGLRNHFWVSPDTATRWQVDGREFTTRFRALTTAVKAVPPLEFQVFDPQSGRYRLLNTDPIPVTIRSGENGAHFDVRSIPGAANVLVAESGGVWANKRSGLMNELFDTLISILVGGFWLWVLFGPLLFLLLRPRVIEWRRRSLDPAHARRVAALRKFRKRPGLDMFREYVAELLDRDGEAMTGDEVVGVLRGGGADEDLVADVSSAFEEADLKRYGGSDDAPMRERDWVSLASRVQRQLLVGLLFFLAVGGLGQVHGGDWDDAEKLFGQAIEMPVDGDARPVFVQAALAFEQCANGHRLEGLAWTNAGNAWFKAGEVGRAIAAYRRAGIHRPFDEELQESLAAARALCVDVVPPAPAPGWLRWPLSWPLRWQLATVALLWVCLWLLLLVRLRFRWKGIKVAGVILWSLLGVFGSSLLTMVILDQEDGVIVVEEVQGRKGPGYGYQPAYETALHQGLEFRRGGRRGDWVEAILPDGSHAWVPRASVELLPR
ncbi:tetratricopeptide repeat protein [Haloferula rosea]|nr:BatD family protein [Haloferula rosea]